jgi:hypothetical protein
MTARLKNDMNKLSLRTQGYCIIDHDFPAHFANPVTNHEEETNAFSSFITNLDTNEPQQYRIALK